MGAVKGQFGQSPNEFSAETISSKSVPEPNSGCWIWLGSMNQWGYGKLSIQKKHWIAHRASFSIFSGQKIPQGMVVMHKCDNRACVNPDHLKLGTNDENMADMVAKGRSCGGDKNTSRKNPHLQVRGSSHPHAKLNERSVAEIKSMLSMKIPQKEIAKKFGVTSNAICEINRGRVWKHVCAGGGLF